MKNTRKITVEIFRPGTFQSMEGKTTSFDEGILSDIAGQYDSNDAPIVIGHPNTSSPAYGWVEALKYDRQQKRLIAELGDIDQSFAEAVKAKRYKKISPSFFRPDAPANPKPGHYYLRHVGFLGAAAPAVTGLKAASFAGAENDAITFKMDFSEMQDNISLFGRFKSWLVEKLGADQAAALLTDDEEAKLLAEPSDNKNENGDDKKAVLLEKAVENPESKAVEPADEKDDGKEKAKKANISYAENALSDREKDIAEREKAIAEREKNTIHAANTSFAEGLVMKGSLLPLNKEKLIEVLDAVDGGVQSFSFADGKSTTTGDAIRQILSKQPNVVLFGETVPKAGGLDDNINFVAPDNFTVDPDRLPIHREALRMQKQTPTLSYEDAVAAVERNL